MEERRITLDRITALSHSYVKKNPILINRNYALLWFGQAISLVGDSIFTTALILWIATRIASGERWAPAAVGALVFVQTIPELLVGPLAGVFADRWRKRATMLGMDAARAALLALLILVSGAVPFLPVVQPPRNLLLLVIYLTVLLVTSCSQFFLPSRLALIADIVPDERRERASSLAQTSSAIASIAGPSIAAPLFFALGPGAVLGLDALSFLASFVAILLVRVPPFVRSASSENGSFLQEFVDGLRLVGSNRVLRVLLVSGAVLMLGGGALNALSIFFLQQNLHASASLFGLMGAAEGAGTLAGAFVAGAVARRMGAARLLWMSAVIFGLLVVVYARLTSFPAGLALVSLIGASFAALEVCEAPLMLRATPRAYVGRVAAILIPAYGVTDIISALVAGWLASTVLHGFHASALGTSLGAIDTIFTAAGLLALCAGWYAMRNLPRATSWLTQL